MGLCMEECTAFAAGINGAVRSDVKGMIWSRVSELPVAAFSNGIFWRRFRSSHDVNLLPN